MGYFIMPVRTEDEPQVDDYVVWSTIDDVPVARGTQEEIRQFWREEFGRQGLATFDFRGPFTRADIEGSNSEIGHARWGDDLRAAVGADAGLLPRAKLREFLDIYFDPAELDIDEHNKVAARLTALLEPFDWEDEEQLTNGAEIDGDGR